MIVVMGSIIPEPWRAPLVVVMVLAGTRVQHARFGKLHPIHPTTGNYTREMWVANRPQAPHPPI